MTIDTEIARCAIVKGSAVFVLWKISRGYYELPGGKVDEGESRREAAIRETEEETGCVVELGEKIARLDYADKGELRRCHLYPGKIMKGKPKTVSKEHSATLMMPIKNYKMYDVAPHVEYFCLHHLKSCKKNKA